MPEPAGDDLDRLVHEPGRLAVLTVLSSVTSADFLFLQRVTRLTNGNLSSHLTKLEEAGLIRIDKSFVHRRSRTDVTLTAEGRRRVDRHWAWLDRLKNFSGEPGTA